MPCQGQGTVLGAFEGRWQAALAQLTRSADEGIEYAVHLYRSLRSDTD